MQCPSFVPGCYSLRDLNGPPSDRPWPVYTNNKSLSMNNQSYINLHPPSNVNQIRVFYQNEVLRRTMLMHENIFRKQVQDLHRLHRRQRELMDECMRGIKDPNVAPVFHDKLILQKVSSDCSSMTWQNPMSPSLSWINPAANRLSTLGSKSPLSPFSFLDTSPKNENGFDSNELLPPKCKKPIQKMLDLELPADDCADSEDENGHETQTLSSHCSNDKNQTMMAFDLNMPPPTLSSELETLLENESGVKPDNDGYPNKIRENFVIPQVSPPSVYGVQSKKSAECPNGRHFETKNKINLIDLNSCADEDEASPAISIAKAIVTQQKIGMEPVSPENKERLPPRRESEGRVLETPVQVSKQEDSDSKDDLICTAAETIFLISKSSFNEKTKLSLVESLDWFAGVAVSSITKNVKVYETACMASDESVKEKTKCIVALPSQQGKPHKKKRRYSKIIETTNLCSISPLAKYNMSFIEKAFKSWGKVTKRRRGARVPTSSIPLLWS